MLTTPRLTSRGSTTADSCLNRPGFYRGMDLPREYGDADLQDTGGGSSPSSLVSGSAVAPALTAPRRCSALSRGGRSCVAYPATTASRIMSTTMAPVAIGARLDAARRRSLISEALPATGVGA